MSAPVLLPLVGVLGRYMCDLMENKIAQGWAAVGALGVVYTVIASSTVTLVSYCSTILMGDVIVFIYLFSFGCTGSLSCGMWVLSCGKEDLVS